MVAESEADHCSEQEASEKHATSPERWKVQVGRGCLNLAVARSRVYLHILESTGGVFEIGVIFQANIHSNNKEFHTVASPLLYSQDVDGTPSNIHFQCPTPTPNSNAFSHPRPFLPLHREVQLSGRSLPPKPKISYLHTHPTARLASFTRSFSAPEVIAYNSTRGAEI